MSEGKWMRLDEAISIRHGYAFKGKFFSDIGPGPILLTPGNFAIRGGFQHGKVRYYLGPVPDDYVLAKGDLIVTMTDLSKTGDTLGYSAIVPEGGAYLHNQRIGLVQLDRPDLLDKSFLYYLLYTANYRNHVLSGATGSTVRHTSPARILSYRFLAPPLARQRAVAEVLRGLDDKIAGNRAIAETADNLAEALFAAEREHPMTRRMNLADVATVVLGGTPSRKKSAYWRNGTINWIGSGRANDFRVIEPTELITSDALAESATKLMPRRATVVAITGATMGKVSRLEIESCGNQSLVGVWAKDRCVNDWIYFWVRAHRAELVKHATGGAQQHINKSIVSGLTVSLPDPDRLKQWGVTVRPLLDGVAASLKENSALLSLRNTLLDPLLSGRIPLRDAGRE